MSINLTQHDAAGSGGQRQSPRAPPRRASKKSRQAHETDHDRLMPLAAHHVGDSHSDGYFKKETYPTFNG